jgi:hypothetical protein
MKTDREKTPIYCKVNPLGLSPSSAFDAELLDDYPKGSEVEITIKRKRSLPQLRLYWKLLHEVVTATDAYPSAEHLHDAIKMALGYTTPLQMLDGGTVQIPDSVAIARMDQQTFKQYFDRALELLSKLMGVDPMSLLAEAA